MLNRGEMKNKYLIIALVIVVAITIFSSVGFGSLIKENNQTIKEKQKEIELLEKKLKFNQDKIIATNNRIEELEEEVSKKETIVIEIKEKRDEKVNNVSTLNELQLDSIITNYKHRD